MGALRSTHTRWWRRSADHEVAIDPLIITVAAVGAELTRRQQPNLPLTPDELAFDAAACEEAGASIYHLHVRDGNGVPTMDVATFRAAVTAITDASTLIVQFTTGGAVTDTEEARVAPLELRPEMATLTTGSVNFGSDVFLNPFPMVERFYVKMRSLGVLPEFEIFDTGMIAAARRVIEEYGDRHHLHYDFVLGVPGGMPAWEDSIEFLESKLPTGATWSATGIGKNHVPVARQTIALGGHVRTGFEDVLYYARGEPATSNRQLVDRVAGFSSDHGRSVATPDQARSLLNLGG